jgi:hypothetical protein
MFTNKFSVPQALGGPGAATAATGREVTDAPPYLISLVLFIVVLYYTLVSMYRKYTGVRENDFTAHAPEIHRG